MSLRVRSHANSPCRTFRHTNRANWRHCVLGSCTTCWGSTSGTSCTISRSCATSSYACQNLHIGEDFVFLYDLLPEVDSFVLLPEYTYAYIIRPDSLSQHGTRKQIPLSEIDEQVYIRSYGKQRFEGLKDQPYAADMVTNLMKYSFEAASYVVDRRKLIVPPAGARQIRELLRASSHGRRSVAARSSSNK